MRRYNPHLSVAVLCESRNCQGSHWQSSFHQWPTSLILLTEMASSRSLMSQWSTSFRELLLRYAYLTASIHIILISSLIHRNTVQILLLSSSHLGTQDTHPHLLPHLPAVSSQSRPILHHASAYSVYSAILLPSCKIVLAESFSRSSV